MGEVPPIVREFTTNLYDLASRLSAASIEATQFAEGSKVTRIIDYR